ncbi:hypothetical protein [Nocardioides eburneiflavus]|uniref:hypothetical protein n=1 Tax=Nocardioides eburneiflavus TaxID=2518372 RepID=UPI001B2FE491
MSHVPRSGPRRTTSRRRKVPLAEPGAGEVVVRNSVISVDPYMRSRINDVESSIRTVRT